MIKRIHQTIFTAICTFALLWYAPTAGADKVKDVNITNTPIDTNVVNGVLVTRDADLPAKQPFQKSTGMVVIFSPDFEKDVPGFVQVPIGKRLVIETVLGRCFAGSANQTNLAILGTTLGGDPEVDYVLPTTPISTNAFTYGGNLRVYADPQTAVNVKFTRNTGSGDSSCRLSISGHFVDVP